MPNFYAHICMCRAVEQRVSPELREILERDEDACLCGGFGPDPLYFYVQGPLSARIRYAGTAIHHHTGAEAMEPFRKPVQENWPYAVAFAAGYLLHYLLDAKCHPFVNQVAQSGAYTHFALEGEYDRVLLRRDGIGYADALPPRELPDVFCELAARMAKPVTPEIYRKALQSFRWVSLRFGAWAGTPVSTAVNAFSHLPPAHSLRGMILGAEPDPGLERYVMTLDRLCESAADAAVEELSRFFEAVKEDRPFSEALGRTYSGKPPAR